MLSDICYAIKTSTEIIYQLIKRTFWSFGAPKSTEEGKKKSQWIEVCIEKSNIFTIYWKNCLWLIGNGIYY